MPEIIQDEVNQLLFQAAASGDIQPIQLLIDYYDIDLNVRDENGFTAYMLAANNDQLDVLNFLHDKKVDVNLSNQFYETALMLAAKNGSVSTINRILGHGGAINEFYIDSPQALLYAIHFKTAQAVAYLLKQKSANPNLMDGNNNSCLMIAAANNDQESAELLINAGAKIDFKNGEGNTALIIAAAKGHKAFAELLIAKNANPFIKNNDDQTAYDIAKQLQQDDTYALLKEQMTNQKRLDYYKCPDSEVPGFFICPISQMIMDDPVTLPSSGITFERSSIQAWQETHGNHTCPSTRQKLNKDEWQTPTDQFVLKKIEKFIAEKTKVAPVMVKEMSVSRLSMFSQMTIKQIEVITYTCDYSGELFVDPIMLPNGKIADREATKQKFAEDKNHINYKAAVNNRSHVIMKKYLAKYKLEVEKSEQGSRSFLATSWFK